MGKDHGLSQQTIIFSCIRMAGNIRELENVSNALLPRKSQRSARCRKKKGSTSPTRGKRSCCGGLLPETGCNLEKHFEGSRRTLTRHSTAPAAFMKAAEAAGDSFRSFRYYANKYN